LEKFETSDSFIGANVEWMGHDLEKRAWNCLKLKILMDANHFDLFKTTIEEKQE